MRINHNIPSLVTYNALTATLAETQKVIQRLSTGLRINSAADDAAGLAISEKMRAQIRGIDKAVANSQDGISMIQTAEGAMNESHSILQRMRELSVQAANDALTMNDREYIQLEMDQLKEELDRIANTTQFNKKKLLDGTADALWSTDLLGTEVIVNGSTLSTDQFGQTVKFDGNFNVVADVVDIGQNQVLKSNILTIATANGIATANVGVALSDLTNFVDANGVNLLQNPQTLTISIEGGGTAEVTVYADDTIGSLGEKLSAALASASDVAASSDVGVQYVSDGGMTVEEAEAAAADVDTLIREMATNWLYGAVKRVYDAYGFEPPADRTLTIKIVDDLGAAAATGGGVFGGDGEITISRSALLDQNGNPKDPEMFERVLAHEMVHVLTYTYGGELARAVQNYQWFSEGLAEYVHGANNSVDASNVASIITAAQTLLANPGKEPIEVENGYAAAYLLVRYLDEQSILGGGNGIGSIDNPDSILGYLASNASAGYSVSDILGEALVAADAGAYGYDNIAMFEYDVNNPTSGDGVLNYENFADFVARVAGEYQSVDTGAIDGYYVANGVADLGDNYALDGTASASTDLQKTHETIVEGNDTYNPQPLLADFGWTVVWPDGITLSESAERSGAGSVLPVSASRSDTLQAVDGTLLLHSNIAGTAGRITISGDEDLIKALGFAEIQSAVDTTYSISVYDAHNGTSVASNVKISGNTIYSVLHENIDVRLTNNFAIGVDASNLHADGYGSYVFAESGRNSFVVHIASNSAVLQIGANQGEDMVISFGNISSAALGVDKVSVRDRELASRATTLIDNAISRVSTKRARLGAYQNRLEHTITNLTAASTNTAAAESRIRDADMAKEMINFTRLNILSQAGNSMLGQANQLPQNVLMLMR